MKISRTAFLIICLSVLNPGSAYPDHELSDRAGYYLTRIPAHARGAYGAVARLALGREVKLGEILGDLDHINSRRDCADFKMAGFLRLLHLYGSDPNLPRQMRDPIIDAVLNFKYWIDEPGKDSMCYWSENHQIIFHSCEYLVVHAGCTGECPPRGRTGVGRRRLHLRAAGPQ